MDHGKLVEQGTFDELKQKNGYFVKLTQEMRGDQDD